MVDEEVYRAGVYVTSCQTGKCVWSVKLPPGASASQVPQHTTYNVVVVLWSVKLPPGGSAQCWLSVHFFPSSLVCQYVSQSVQTVSAE